MQHKDFMNIISNENEWMEFIDFAFCFFRNLVLSTAQWAGFGDL